jgi:hypothetical protein
VLLSLQIIPEDSLVLALRAAAIVELTVAILNLNLVRVMGWRVELDRLPLLLRQVFYVHAFFISLTLVIFAVLTWCFAPDMAAGQCDVTRWLAAAIGSFWAIRAAVQIFYYSPSHWRGRSGPGIVHITLLVLYSAMGAAYLLAAAGE